MIKEITSGTSLFFHINSNFWEFFLKRVGINNSGRSGFQIFIFVKFFRVGIFFLLRPAVDFGSVLLLVEFLIFPL